MKVIQNTLYVLTQGAYLHHDHQSVKVDIEKKTRMSIPLHNIESIACFGNIMISPHLMGLCAKAGVSITFLSMNGYFMARVDAPVSGNVLLRREQFRLADQPEATTAIAKYIVAGKLQNSRTVLLRSARDKAQNDDESLLRSAASSLAQELRLLETSDNCDKIRGHEGNAARIYFGVFDRMIHAYREDFKMNRRSRRPPRDRVNCLLSFVYALLINDCVGALVSAGLDPNVGYLHGDRPGRPSLALDLMEEFRSIFADRFVLTLINRKQVSHDDFIIREGGAVEMKDKTRRAVVHAWQQRKQDEITHMLLEQKSNIGLIPHLQAKIMARHIRGDMEAYVPFILK